VLRKLAKEYQALNGTEIDRVDGQYIKDSDWPRWLHIGRPVLIENYFAFGKDDDSEEWTDEWLEQVLGSWQALSIAVTPDGEADALKVHTDGQTYFVEPFTEPQDIGSFLASFEVDDDDDDGDQAEEEQEVRYLQSQNGNIYNASLPLSELRALQDHIPVDVPFVFHSTGASPDAVNCWIGDHRSATSLHSDPYENIYHVVRGVKYFTLFPPTETCLFEEQEYPHAIYTRDEDDKLQLTPSDPAEHRPVRWLSFDPDHPPEGTKPIYVTVNEGETLYLPAGWNHYVRQAGPGGGEGLCLSLNWWYDVEMEGMPWVWLSFLRKGARYLEDDNEEEEAVEELEPYEVPT